MMADEQESSKQTELMDHANSDDNADEIVATEGRNAQLDEHNGTAVNLEIVTNQAEETTFEHGQSAIETGEKQATVVAQQHAEEADNPGSGKTSCLCNPEDRTDMNRIPSNQDLSDNKEGHDSILDSICQDVNNDPSSQNLNRDPSNEDSDMSPADQDTRASPPEQNLTRDYLSNQDSLPDPKTNSPIQESSDNPPPQDSNGLPAGYATEADRTQEDHEATDINAQHDPGEADGEGSQPEPDQMMGDAGPVTEDTGDSVPQMVPVREEIQLDQTVGDDHLVTEEDADGLPDADANQCVGTEGISATDGVASSQQPPAQEQTIKDSGEGIAGIADNPDRMSSSPQSPTHTETPSPVQQNNNNELSESRQFVNESVHIPTASVGDLDESVSNRGSQSNVRDPAMDKMMRSSLPADAYGDCKSHHLPALIHPDPRLARSLPASMDQTNIPNGYYNSRGAHRAHKQMPRIPSASGSTKADMREGDVRRTLNSAKLPPSVMKMSTVTVSARKRAVLNRNASIFYEERQHRKVISLDQAINSRPPMPFDLDGPGPWSYSPRNKPLNEDNSPEYTFGHRVNEKGGGGRTAYAKHWFNSNNGFTQKVHFEKRWPSPAHYNSTRPLLGRRKPTMLDYPSFTIGVRGNFKISKRGSENEPSPNEYNRSKSDSAILRTAPSYTISHRHQGTKLWGGNETTPGPGAYNPRWGHSSALVHHPSFTIQGVRRTKSHQLGPHSTF